MIINPKIAVIGAGKWGINLIRNLRGLNALSCIVDPMPSNLKIAGSEAPEVTLLTDYNLLLSKDIDAVVIASPAETHYQIAKKFLDEGKDVFIEKPITLKSLEAIELVEMAKAKQNILMVGHLLIYQPAIQHIKNLLKNNTLGKIYHIQQKRLQFGKFRTIENVAWSIGVHDIAVLLYLIGQKPNEVMSIGHCGVQKDIEDNIHIHMTFDCGIQSHLHCSWLWPEIERQLTIIGSNGIIFYDEMKQEVILSQKKVNESFEIIDLGSESIFKGSNQPLLLEMKHFLDCIRSRKDPITDGESAVDVVEILESLAIS